MQCEISYMLLEQKRGRLNFCETAPSFSCFY